MSLNISGTRVINVDLADARLAMDGCGRGPAEPSQDDDVSKKKQLVEAMQAILGERGFKYQVDVPGLGIEASIRSISGYVMLIHFKNELRNSIQELTTEHTELPQRFAQLAAKIQNLDEGQTEAVLEEFREIFDTQLGVSEAPATLLDYQRASRELFRVLKERTIAGFREFFAPTTEHQGLSEEQIELGAKIITRRFDDPEVEAELLQWAHCVNLRG